MRDKRTFNLNRRNPLSTYLEHIVGAATIPEVAVYIFIVLVTCMNPLPVENIFRLFVLIPIICSSAISAYQQITYITLLYCVATLIGNHSFVSWHQPAGTTGSNLPCAITDKNMQNFCTADAIK